MMQITATELKQNLGKYLSLSKEEDIIITRNGIPIAKLSSLNERNINLVRQLTGIIPDDGTTMDDVRMKRLHSTS